MGFGQTAADRLSNEAARTLTESAAFFGLSYAGVKLLSSTATPFRYVVPVLGTALTYSFAGNLAKSLPEHANNLAGSWSRTWNDRNIDLEKEKQVFANAIGPFLFDSTVAITSGVLGGKLASRQIQNSQTLNLMLEKHGAQIKENVFTIASQPAADGLRTMGTAFSVKQNQLGTAFHVVQDRPGQNWFYFNSVGKGQVKVLAGLPQRDLALLALADGKPSFKAFELAKDTRGLDTRGVIVGAESGKKIKVKPANLQYGLGPRTNSYIADLGYEQATGRMHTVNGGRGWPGMSGGPAIAANGEVVGILSTTNPILNVISNVGTSSAPASSMRYLLKLVERSKQASSTMSLAEAAKAFKMPETQVLNMIRKEKLEAFLQPSPGNEIAWQWRIMRPAQ